MDVTGKLLTSTLINWVPVALLLFSAFKFRLLSAATDLVIFVAAMCFARFGWTPKFIQMTILSLWYVILPVLTTVIIML